MFIFMCICDCDNDGIRNNTMINNIFFNDFKLKNVKNLIKTNIVFFLSKIMFTFAKINQNCKPS